MVLEQIIERRIVTKHLPFVFLLSLVYVFVAYAVQELFFPGQSVAAVLLVTILLVPSLHHLIVIEEEIERKGSTHFWRRHKTIIKCYSGAFLGLLTGFLILGSFNPESLGFQLSQLELSHLKPEMVAAFSDAPFVPTINTTLALFSHNLSYLLIGFALSIFYGAGAIFLVVFNASFFAAFAIEVINRWGSGLVGVSLLHLLPETFGFILTAIAGATLSRGIIHEKVTGKAFRNVLQNAIKLIGFALLFILLAAFIETYVTAPAFSTAI